MKKNLLFVLPLLMVLSSCSNISKEQYKEDIMLEDTSYHEELFNEEINTYELHHKQPNRLASDLVEPPVGVQFLSYEDPSDSKTYYAVRYVAAVKSLDITATWTRAVSQKDGTQVRTLANNINTTKAYRSLNNGGVISTASTDYPGFEYYVVYTMYKIPISHEDSYIMAYLTLSYAEETPVKSKAVVAQIKGNDNGGRLFSFDVDSATNDYFLAIHHTVGEDTIYYGEEGEDKPNPDKAIFTNDAMEFSTDDSFGLFKLSSSEFIFYSHPSYFGSTASRTTKLANSHDNYSQLYLDGKYHFYVNHEDQVYVSPTDVEVTLSLVPNDNWNQILNGHAPRFAVYAFGGSAEARWFDLTQKGAQNLYELQNFNIGTYPTVIFCRMDGNVDKLDNNWDNRANQTNNLVINGELGPTIINYNKYTIADGAWSNGDGSWSK